MSPAKIRKDKAVKARSTTEPLAKNDLLPAFDNHYSVLAAQAKDAMHQFGDHSDM